MKLNPKIGDLVHVWLEEDKPVLAVIAKVHRWNLIDVVIAENGHRLVGVHFFNPDEVEATSNFATPVPPDVKNESDQRN